MQSLERIRAFKPFIIATTFYLMVMHIALCVSLFPMALRGRPDFRHLYTAGYMVRSGYAHQLYDEEANRRFQSALSGPLEITLTFNHLAYEALLFAPIALLPFRSAYVTFFAANLAMLWACYWMLRPYLSNVAAIWQWLPAGMFLCFFPITVALVQGQDSIIILALLTAAFVAFRKGNDFRSGVLVGLTLFKFQFTLPILLLFFAWKRWRAAMGCLATGVVLAGLSVWITGISAVGVYARSLVSLGSMMSTQARQQQYGIHPEAMPNLRGVFHGLAGHYVPHSILQITTIFCSILLLYWVARGRPSFSLAIMGAMLVSYHGLIHDASVLILPIGLLGSAYLTKDCLAARWAVGIMALILVSPTFLMQTGGPNWVLAVPILLLLVLSSKMPGEPMSDAFTYPIDHAHSVAGFKISA